MLEVLRGFEKFILSFAKKTAASEWWPVPTKMNHGLHRLPENRPGVQKLLHPSTVQQAPGSGAASDRGAGPTGSQALAAQAVRRFSAKRRGLPRWFCRIRGRSAQCLRLMSRSCTGW